MEHWEMEKHGETWETTWKKRKDMEDPKKNT
jgi:hypothetical protein